MRVLLDECLPRRLRRELPGHDIRTVPECGWAGVKNGQLLSTAVGHFDVFLTIDGHLATQQNLPTFAIAVVALRAVSHDLDDLRPLIPELLLALPSIQPLAA